MALYRFKPANVVICVFVLFIKAQLAVLSANTLFHNPCSIAVPCGKRAPRVVSPALQEEMGSDESFVMSLYIYMDGQGFCRTLTILCYVILPNAT